MKKKVKKRPRKNTQERLTNKVKNQLGFRFVGTFLMAVGALFLIAAFLDSDQEYYRHMIWSVIILIGVFATWKGFKS